MAPVPHVRPGACGGVVELQRGELVRRLPRAPRGISVIVDGLTELTGVVEAARAEGEVGEVGGGGGLRIGAEDGGEAGSEGWIVGPAVRL